MLDLTPPPVNQARLNLLFPLGFSLLFSSTVLLFYSGILPCYCYYSHASLAVMLVLCSFNNWDNTSNHCVQCHVHANCDTGSVSDSSSLLPRQIVRMLLSLCWLQFYLLLWVVSVDTAIIVYLSHIMLSIIDSSLDTTYVLLCWSQPPDIHAVPDCRFTAHNNSMLW